MKFYDFWRRKPQTEKRWRLNATCQDCREAVVSYHEIDTRDGWECSPIFSYEIPDPPKKRKKAKKP